MHYLAYGSNLHPLRLTARTPGAQLIGVTEIAGYRLCFNKRSLDGSAKCSLACTGMPTDSVYGAVYDLPDNEIRSLDEIEGVGQGYSKQRLGALVNDEALQVFTYIASRSHLVHDLVPYDWYKGFVLAGAAYHRFPPEYIGQIRDIDATHDEDAHRNARNQELLSLLRASDREAP